MYFQISFHLSITKVREVNFPSLYPACTALSNIPLPKYKGHVPSFQFVLICEGVPRINVRINAVARPVSNLLPLVYSWKL